MDKIRRIKHNLVHSKKEDDEELKIIAQIEVRNSKLCAAINTFRKDLAASFQTGFKEENIDKRKRKLVELVLSNNLKDFSVDLDYLQTTCIHKVMLSMSITFHFEAEETVKLELITERLIWEELAAVLEAEKSYQKSKEKLTNAYTDLDIKQKTLEKEPSAAHQESVDAAQLKVESLRDGVMTDAFTQATKEQETAKTMAKMMQLRYEYHKQMADEYARLLPELQKYIDSARPRPMFGVDLTEHLAHSQTSIAVVIEKCCSILRVIGFTEKGLFRVNGNNSRIRRMKAAFDAGQIDNDSQFYYNDPFSICSVLKSYLRELPDPLLTNELQSEWIQALRLTDEDQLVALEGLIQQLPQAHRDNLVYLMNFLSDLEQYKDVTAMNASNLAIVIGPNIMGIQLNGPNTAGTALVEIFINNAARLFGLPAFKQNLVDAPEQVPQTSAKPSVLEMASNFTRSMSAVSPRTARPKDKAPPPPSTDKIHPRADSVPEVSETDGVDVGDESFHTPVKVDVLSRSFTEKSKKNSARNSNELPQGRPMSYHYAVGTSKSPENELITPQEIGSVRANLSRLFEASDLSPPPTAPDRKRHSVLEMLKSSKSKEPSSSNNVTNAGNNRTLVTVDDDPVVSTEVHLSNAAPTEETPVRPAIPPPPPMSALKPKPPIPVKPKDLGDNKESSRL